MLFNGEHFKFEFGLLPELTGIETQFGDFRSQPSCQTSGVCVCVYLLSRHHTQRLCVYTLGVPEASLQLSVQLHQQL
jgi:hypothetical protein